MDVFLHVELNGSEYHVKLGERGYPSRVLEYVLNKMGTAPIVALTDAIGYNRLRNN